MGKIFSSEEECLKVIDEKDIVKIAFLPQILFYSRLSKQGNGEISPAPVLVCERDDKPGNICCWYVKSAVLSRAYQLWRESSPESRKRI